MTMKFLREIYCRIPGIRELVQLSESAHDTRNLARRIYHSLRQINAVDSVRLFDFDLKRHPRYSDPLRLLRYAFPVCSQNGEDGIISEIFRRIGTGDRTFAEVGVGDGTQNNTAFLLSQGWTGFWIDGDSTFRETLAKAVGLEDGCLKSTVSFVSKENVVEIFNALGVPEEFDLLSLDIDQNTYYVWEALTGFRPRAVVIEYNAAIPPDIEWRVKYDSKRTWDGSHNFGASLKALEVLGRHLGYSLVGCEFCGVNAFFVRDDLVADKFAAPFTSENHYEPPRNFLMHQRSHPTAILDRTPFPLT
jgi:hypothetical protein